MRKSLYIAASLITLAFAPALAFASGNCNQACTPVPMQVINGQIQLGDAIAFNNVVVGSSNGAAITGAAAGNSMSASSTLTPMNVSSTQYLDGNVNASNVAIIGQARGNTVSVASAQGNAAQVVGCCSNLDVHGEQISQYGNNIVASSYVQVGSSDNVLSSAQATANNWATSSYHGTVAQHVGQYNAANVWADSHVDACCNNGVVASNAVAVANTNSMYGDGSTLYSSVNQKNYGNAGASAIIHNNSATDNTAAATAVANNATVTNQRGYAELAGNQENWGDVHARSVVLNGDWSGQAVSSANAMGNSALITNIGSDAGMYLDQANYSGAPVTAYAGLFGSSSHNGVGVASSSAIGNAITGFTCAGCGQGGVSMNSNTSQYNASNVVAHTQVGVGTAGMISASATAVGNSATFIARGN
ncbi:MAG: hypothetical protein FD163_1779 [Hyphomonadaceae bacterium]|nr:MAG: hypothetical protein FD128_1410 [Hyphomonadaceae bacterium]KAF0185082.1 MAG: hypothetical protein FD163_1779 [Hyphomonadaceae bacterium]